MADSLRPFFNLLHRAGQSRPLRDLQRDLGEQAFAALYAAGWLDIVPSNDGELPPGESLVSRSILTLQRIVKQRLSQSGELLCDCAPNERQLLESVSRWLALNGMVPRHVNIGGEPVLLGWLEWPTQRPAFFVRRVAHINSLARLDQFENQGGAVVITTTLESTLPGFIRARYNGPSPVRLLILEEYAEVRDTRVYFREAPDDVRSQGTTFASTPGCDIITLEGRRRLTGREADDLRRASRDYDLFVDFTVPVFGLADYYAGCARHGDVHWTFALTHFEGAILREFVSAPNKVLAPESLRCSMDLQIRTPVRKFCDMRRKVDVRYERNSYRVLHGHKNGLGRTDRFCFRPPPGFKLAVLDHLPE